MSIYDRVSVLASMVVLGLVLLSFMELPTKTLSFLVFGSVISLQFSAIQLLAVLLIGLACTGTESVVRSYPLSQREELAYTFVFWILPSSVVLLSVLLLSKAPNLFLWLGGLLLTFASLALVVIAEYRTVNISDPYYVPARIGLNFTAYLMALAFFIIIHLTKASSPVSYAIGVAFPLALEILYGAKRSLRKALLYSFIISLAIGESVWAFNYWKLSGLRRGVLLFLIFYFMSGLSRQHLLGRVNRRTIVEFAIVVIAGFWIVLRYG
jgi:hypothetical protein